MELKTKTALITGASGGIGLEIAKLFAKDNYNLVIVSRDENKLNEIAQQLKAEGAGEVTVIAKDLSVDGAASQLYAETTKRHLEINFLVNNAGVGVHGEFIHTELEKELRSIHLNVITLVTLTKLYLRDMVTRNEGRILQLASAVSYAPSPLLAVYAATKAFVLSFNDALISELENSKITMTALIPGATDTDFFRKAGMEHSKAALHKESAAPIAKQGYEAMMKGDRHAVAPGVKKLILLSSVLPNNVVANQAKKRMENDSHI